jgi:hypothetical protein
VSPAARRQRQPGVSNPLVPCTTSMAQQAAGTGRGGGGLVGRRVRSQPPWRGPSQPRALGWRSTGRSRAPRAAEPARPSCPSARRAIMPRCGMVRATTSAWRPAQLRSWSATSRREGDVHRLREAQQRPRSISAQPYRPFGSISAYPVDGAPRDLSHAPPPALFPALPMPETPRGSASVNAGLRLVARLARQASARRGGDGVRAVRVGTIARTARG